jgi:hypothetical protein
MGSRSPGRYHRVVTGLLVPLVLAAVLSVVAVKAARRGPMLVASPGAIPAPPRPAVGLLLSRRRLAGAGIAAAAVVGLLALAGQGGPHSGGDPGGRTLAALRPATAAVPAGAQILARQESEPSWMICAGAPVSGWTQVAASVQFSVSLSPSRLIEGVDRQLADRGWRLVNASGAGAAWTKALPGGGQAQAALVPTGRTGVWQLRLSAPAQGAQLSESC